MSLISKIAQKINWSKFATVIYPLFVVLAIPVLLAINTIWNLKSFNRDANFIVRHNAVSVAETAKPGITESMNNVDLLQKRLTDVANSSDDIVSSAIIQKDGQSYQVLASSNGESKPENLSDITLNGFALSTNQSYAGLKYDPFLQKNVWRVSVPLQENSQIYVLALNLSTDSVDQILSRTSKDSLVLLVTTLVIAIALLINHIIFYKRSLRAQQLEELGKLKDEFISMASHELRAPVTGLVGYLELLKDKLGGNLTSEMQEDFSTLGMLTENLQKLINDLLEVSRIEQGRIKITKKETNVNELLENAVKEYTPMANQKGLQLNLTAETLPKIVTDGERASQVLTNLISNAIKYTIQGKIEINAKQDAKFIKITVKDTGIGIPATEMEKLFTKFMRVKDEKTKDVRGTGLGLWITKQMVETLGGKIEVQSIYGTGTTFTFALPIS